MKSHSKNIFLNDKAFVDLCRCLYQAKIVVRDLESFSNTLCPALNHNPKLLNNVLLKQANDYITNAFRKFTRLCKLLLLILAKMETSSSGQVKRERIDSFRAEVWQEWKMATNIKQKILQLLQLNNDSTLTYTSKSAFTTNTSAKTAASEL